MFCPECKTEYRDGFTRCSDCDVDLVDVLPEEESKATNGLIKIWECVDQSECVSVCKDLQQADIPYHVEQALYDRSAGKTVSWVHRILISGSDLEGAKEVLGIDGPQNTISSPEDDSQELVDPSLELADAGVPLNDAARREKYLDRWDPEDATVEVGAETDELPSWIERALDANYVRCRCDSDGRGGRKIFVRLEDEEFAREIVREILEGRPRQ